MCHLLFLNCRFGVTRHARSHLQAAVQGTRTHVVHQLQGPAQLLPGAAQHDHGGVRARIAQRLERVLVRQAPHPVEQLPGPAQSQSSVPGPDPCTLVISLHSPEPMLPQAPSPASQLEADAQHRGGLAGPAPSRTAARPSAASGFRAGLQGSTGTPQPQGRSIDYKWTAWVWVQALTTCDLAPDSV